MEVFDGIAATCVFLTDHVIIISLSEATQYIRQCEHDYKKSWELDTNNMLISGPSKICDIVETSDYIGTKCTCLKSHCNAHEYCDCSNGYKIVSNIVLVVIFMSFLMNWNKLLIFISFDFSSRPFIGKHEGLCIHFDSILPNTLK